MYHLMVRRKLRQAFRQLNAGDYESILKQFGPKFEHAFPGDHTFSGTRHTLDSSRCWYERLYRVFPDLQFEIKNILVTGWPWNTLAAVEWADRASTAAGEPYTNAGVHIFRLRWGRVAELHIYCDTQKLGERCRQLAEEGVLEAVAGPIED